MTTYKITRMFQRDSVDGRIKRTIKTGLTLEEAQAHCHNPETSSSTAKLPKQVAYTRRHGPWFDGYNEE